MYNGNAKDGERFESNYYAPWEGGFSIAKTLYIYGI